MTAAPLTLRDRIEIAVAAHHDEECLVLPDARLSYGEVDRIANATAQALLERGVREGDVVMTLCHNGVAIVATWFACIKLGAVFSPLNASLRGDPLAHVVERAAGRVLICDGPLASTAMIAASGTTSVRHTLAAGGQPPAGCESFERAIGAAASQPPPAIPVNPAAPARLMFTSGTTGESKGVLWSRHAETLHAVHYGDELVRTAPGETVYTCLPLFHVTAQGTLLGAMLRGGRVAADRRFEPLRFWARTRAEHAVFFPYVGTIISTLMARAPRRDDVDNPVRRAMGSATPAGLWRDFERRFGVTLEDVWGQTETASCWTHSGPRGPVPGTVGIPSGRFQARVVREEGAEASEGDPGELWIRPFERHVIFEGYAGDADGRGGDGPDDWYRTGDLMSRGPDGLMTLYGRLREAIRRRGETIPPAEIEAVALQHPSIVEAAAVGVPADDGVEDEILLCVVTRPPAPTPSSVHAFLEARLPRFMVPRFIRSSAALPKTATTRIRRVELQAGGRAGAWDSRAGRGRRG
jgi:carnitine-CoA ligase